MYAEEEGGGCSSERHKTAFARFLGVLRNNPYFQRAWEEARAGLPPAGDDGLSVLVKTIERARAAPAGEVQEIARAFQEKDQASFLRVAARVNARYAALANETYLPALGITGKLTPSPGGKADKEKITVAVRDRDMFDNLADVYCLAAAEGRNMAASVGDDHVSGVARRLGDWSQGRIPLETARSFHYYSDRDASGPLIEALEKLGAPAPRAETISLGLRREAAGLEGFDFAAAEIGAATR